MRSVVEVVGFTVAYAAGMLVALMGNALLIYLVWKKPETRTLTSFMFVNMAVADLLVTLVVMPVSIAHIHTNGAWISGMIGEITCRCFYFAVFVSISASILCLVFIAIDRFFAVMYPFRRLVWFRKPKVLAPLIWILSMTFMSMTFAIVDLDDQLSICRFNFKVLGDESVVLQVVFVYFFIINYALPLAIICILYAIIAHKIWFHEAPGNVSSENQQGRLMTKRKVVRMLIIIVSVFALCWLPGQVYQLMLVSAKGQLKLPPIVMNVCYWFGHVNSAINPWLYIGLNEKFNSAFWRMIKKRDTQNDEINVECRLHLEPVKCNQVIYQTRESVSKHW